MAENRASAKSETHNRAQNAAAQRSVIFDQDR